MTNKDVKGRPYYECEDCAEDGYCTLYGHPCGSLRCNGKPAAYQPDEDREV